MKNMDVRSSGFLLDQLRHLVVVDRVDHLRPVVEVLGLQAGLLRHQLEGVLVQRQSQAAPIPDKGGQAAVSAVVGGLVGRFCNLFLGPLHGVEVGPGAVFVVVVEGGGDVGGLHSVADSIKNLHTILYSLKV